MNYSKRALFCDLSNSGQVWKFSDKEIAKKVFSKIDKEEWKRN